jgi:hypothetical protein
MRLRWIASIYDAEFTAAWWFTHLNRARLRSNLLAWQRSAPERRAFRPLSVVDVAAEPAEMASE